MQTVPTNLTTDIRASGSLRAMATQDVLALAQWEQARAFGKFLKTWRCNRTRVGQVPERASIVLGTN